MIKLLRDSLFNPKNIIHYRAKKTWFVILYVLLVASIYAISMASTPLSYDGLDYTEKIALKDSLSSNNATITEYNFDADNSFIVKISGYSVAFLKEDEDLKTYLSSNNVDFLVTGSDFKIVSTTAYGSKSLKIMNLKEILGDDYSNAIFSGMSENDGFLSYINDYLITLKPLAVLFYFVSGLISGAITILFYALLSYLFLSFTIRASRYMKKDQLFKMMVFSSTGIVIAESITYLFEITGIASFGILLLGFFPIYILEREFMRRIRLQQFGESVMDNESVLNKINEMLDKNKKENEENNNDDNNKEE